MWMADKAEAVLEERKNWNKKQSLEEIDMFA